MNQQTEEQRQTIEYLKKLVAKLIKDYPILKAPGMLYPDEKGRTVLPPSEALILLDPNNKDVDFIVGGAMYVVSERLNEIYKDEVTPPEDLPAIVNRHYNFAELLLLHHDESFPGIYKENIKIFEEKRGRVLSVLACSEDSVQEAWMEYGYWLTGRDEEVNRKAAAFQFRQAHDAGNIDATQALAFTRYADWDDVDEAVTLWEQATVQGNQDALQNLTTVVIEDERLNDDQRASALGCIWEGVALMKEGTRAITQALKYHGYKAPKASKRPERALNAS